MKIDGIERQINFVVMRTVCALIASLLMVIGTIFVAPPAMSLIVIVIGFFVLVASFGAADRGDVQRIAGGGLMAIALIFFMFGVNPDLVTGSTFQVKNPGGEVLCSYSEENPCTARHLKTFFYSLFWR
ncbi:MAG: hypothetical protein E6Q68_00785 [Polynucleobacter sp.]|nr:MAG: hypothetical protein E6Q68_00785 [Polynucleobacter sp.]